MAGNGASVGRRVRAVLLAGCARAALPAAMAAGISAGLAAGTARPALAQEAGVFVQMAARSSRAEAEAEARRFAESVAGVSGYAAPGGWYVVVAGPFDPAEARERLDRLRDERRIPRDSFLVDGGRLRERFFAASEPAGPEGADEGPPPRAEAAPGAPVVDLAGAAALLGDETEEEARASEALLTRAERDLLQVALADSGFYEGPIDGAFGRGTRDAMAAWQAARGLETTGVLTGAQRGTLVAQYNTVLEGLDLAMVRDSVAGIDLEMPTALVALAAHETPFARYEATGEVPEARVVLISREGERDDLAGLYEIMQTLAIVPPDGPRDRTADGFDIEGRGPQIVSRTHVVHRDGIIKGFTLVWPAGDERFDRMWRRMKASFDPTPPAVLGDGQRTPAEAQDIDLLAGLDVRQPDLARSGFFADGAGRVLTTAEVAEGCRSIRLDDVHEARVVWTGGDVALLEPEEPLAPPAVASLGSVPLRIGDEVAAGGFPFGGALGRASVTFGTLADVRGLGGEPERDRYRLETVDAEAGGPVLGPGGEVVGLLLARTGARVLPPDVALGVDAAALRAALEAGGIEVAPPAQGEPLGPEDIVRRAAGITVQVSCYR